MEAILLKQKRKQLSAFVLGLLGLIAQPSVNALETFKPYAGFDVQQRTVKMVPGFGEGLFNKRVPQGNIYVGFNFHEYFGVEIGQQFTQGSTRTALTPENTLLLGFPVDLGDFYVTTGNVKMYGTRANVVGRIPLPITSSHLLLSAGAIALQVKNTVQIIAVGAGVFDTGEIERNTFKFYSKRVVPQFSGGLGFDISNNIKIQFLTGYEVTSKFKNMQNKFVDPIDKTINNNFVMSLKNNLTYGIRLNFRL